MLDGEDEAKGEGSGEEAAGEARDTQSDAQSDTQDTGSEGAAGNEQAEAEAPAPYLPDGLPANMRGATDQETIDKLAKGYANARKAISKAGKPPADVEGYSVDDAELAEALSGDENVAAVNAFKAAALSAGVTNEQFNTLLADVMANTADLVTGDAIDAEAEVEKMGGAEAAKKLQDPVIQWGESLVAKGVLTAGERDAMAPLLATADGTKALWKIRSTMLGGRETEIPPEAQVPNGEVTEAMIAAEMNDVYYGRSGTPAEQREQRAKVKAMHEKRFPN